MSLPAPEEDNRSLAEDEQEHRQEIELRTLSFRFQIATAIVAAILFSMLVALLAEGFAQVRHWSFRTPDWFIDICKLVISAGLIALSTGTLAILNKGGDSKKIGKK